MNAVRQLWIGERIGERCDQPPGAIVNLHVSGVKIGRIEERLAAAWVGGDGESFVNGAPGGVVLRDDSVVVIAHAPARAQRLCRIEIRVPTDNRPVLGCKQESRCGLSRVRFAARCLRETRNHELLLAHREVDCGVEDITGRRPAA